MPQIQNHFFASSLMIIQKMVKMMMIIEMTCHKTGVEQPRIPSQEDIKTGEKTNKILSFCNFAMLRFVCRLLYYHLWTLMVLVEKQTRALRPTKAGACAVILVRIGRFSSSSFPSFSSFSSPSSFSSFPTFSSFSSFSAFSSPSKYVKDHHPNNDYRRAC